jgi:putative Holliday junction resolvase
MGIFASPLETVDTKQLERYLADYFQKEEVSTIVVGYPRQMNGEPSETMRFILPLVGRLKHAYPDKQVVTYDERFTSVLAQRTIRESGIGKMARRDKSLVDKVSAAIILQDYMASVGM